MVTMQSACKTAEQNFSHKSGISVLDYGADPTGKIDASLAFQKAIDSKASKTVVPSGTYLINNTVEVKGYLFLEAGVHILRTQSNSDGPVFWLSTSKASITGEHKGVLIESRTSCPKGIIRIGHGDSSKQDGNILYCSVENVTIKGNGDDVSKGIYLINNQDKGDPSLASYFHNIRNLIIEYVHIGIHLHKMSNANSVSQIYFNRVGDDIEGTAILIEGAMENRIYDCFHHFSPNSVTIRMDRYDNLYPMYNYIYGVVAEQGGDQAVCVDIKSGLHNIVEVNCNAVKGNRVFKEFYERKNSLKRKE